MHVEVGEVDLRNEIVPSDELLDGVQALHHEVLVPDVLVRPAQIDASTHFVGTFLQDGEEGALEAIGGLRRELLDGADLDIVLESGRARQSLLAENWIHACRVEGKIALRERDPIDWHRL